MLVSAANALPGVGAMVSLGKELNDVQAIIASGTESAKEIIKTVNDATVDGLKQYEEIKNTNLRPSQVKNIVRGRTPTLPATSLPATTTIPSIIPTVQKGGRNLRMLQRAGATINNRVHHSINEFLKTRKNKKKVRFSI
jgi:hypothetical protein